MTYRKESRRDLAMDMGMRYYWEKWLGYSRQHYGREWTPDDLTRTLRYIHGNQYRGPAAVSFRRIIEDPSTFAQEWTEMKAMWRRPKVDEGKAQALREAGHPADAQPKPQDPEHVATVLKRGTQHIKEWKKQMGWE